MNQTKQQIEDEYDKIKDLALAEYSKITALEYAKYEKIIDLALAEYSKITAPAYAEYKKIKDLALSEKERKLGELEDIKIIDGKKYRLVD